MTQEANSNKCWNSQKSLKINYFSLKLDKGDDDFKTAESRKLMSHKNTAQPPRTRVVYLIQKRRWGKKVGLIVNFHDKLLIWLFVLIRSDGLSFVWPLWWPMRGRDGDRTDQSEPGSLGVWKGGTWCQQLSCKHYQWWMTRAVTRCRAQMRGAATLSRSPPVSPDHFNTETRHWSLRADCVISIRPIVAAEAGVTFPNSGEHESSHTNMIKLQSSEVT